MTGLGPRGVDGYEISQGGGPACGQKGGVEERHSQDGHISAPTALELEMEKEKSMMEGKR